VSLWYTPPQCVGEKISAQSTLPIAPLSSKKLSSVPPSSVPLSSVPLSSVPLSSKTLSSIRLFSSCSERLVWAVFHACCLPDALYR
jgi:hypothetical protein